MRKVCVVITSRSTYGRLKSVCEAIQKHPQLELQLIVGASLYDLPVDFPIDAKIRCLIAGDDHKSMTLTSSLMMAQLGNELERLKPDIVLVHGDRYEVLPVAATSALMNIPVAHTEGGEYSGSIDGKIRWAISALADFHFTVTEKARRSLNRPNVYCVGSTALDILKTHYAPNKEPYIVILWHPNTTDPEPIEPLIEALQRFDIKKIWVNPNVDAGSKSILQEIHQQKVEFVKNLPPTEYAKLIYNSRCLIGNTSSGIKEGSFLGVPYVCIGNRQADRESDANTIKVENSCESIYWAIKANLGKYFAPSIKFGDGTAGQKIAKILAGVSL